MVAVSDRPSRHLPERFMDSCGSRQRTTELLQRVGAGDSAASEELMNHVHSELVELARAQMARQNEGHTLQATSLVNEAYLRLVDARYDGWETRHHFFAMVSRIMRTILVDHARRKNSGKRGGGQVGVALETGHGGGEALPDLDLLDLHEALGKLERIDGELAQFVELRYFAGRTVKEIAEMMETPLTTTERRLRTAMAWLREAMGHGGRTD